MQRKTEAYIHIKARLWNSTLVSDYPRVDVVNIASHAQFTNTYGIQQETKDDWTTVSIIKLIIQLSQTLKSLVSHIYIGRNTSIPRTFRSSW